MERFVAGAGAGGAATLLTYPLDVVRARMAVAGPGARLWAETAAVLSAGPATAFRGVAPTLLVRLCPTLPFAPLSPLTLRSSMQRRCALSGPHANPPWTQGIMPYSGVAWLTYQSLGDFLADLRVRREEAAAASADPPGAPRGAQEAQRARPTQGEKLVAGAAAGLVGQSATYPLDVARRRMQVGGEMGAGGMVAVLRRAVEQEGARALFKGLSLNWFKARACVSWRCVCAVDVYGPAAD